MEKKTTLGYTILRAFTWFVYRFPISWLYRVSDLMFWFVYSLLRYRRKIVESNLANSFPDKTDQERQEIARQFYHHMCDLFFEMLYYDRMTAEESRATNIYLNADLAQKYLDQGRHVVVFTSHYDNWEYCANLPLFLPNHLFYPIYKKLTSTTFDRFYFKLRSQHGGKPLERADTFRALIGEYQKGNPTISAFLFDQTPRIYDIQLWVKFLNQDTPVVLGAEKIARKIDAVVIFAHSRKVKRGHYELEFKLVTEHAAECPKYELTERCTKLLEQQILEQPAHWLWSHKRWKHKKIEPQLQQEAQLAEHALSHG